MKIKRKPDWQARLVDYVNSTSSVPFSWEKGNDCAKWSANAVREMTGTDVIKGMRAYRSPAGGKAILRKHGYKSHLDRLREVFEEIPPGLAVPGDIAVMENDGLGIVQGDFYVYRPGEKGVALTHRVEMKKAFRVEF